MGHRREHNYPPYQRLARVIIRAKEMDAGAQFAEKAAGVFQAALQSLAGQATDVRLLGPAEAPVFRLKGHYRYHFQLQSPSPGAVESRSPRKWAVEPRQALSYQLLRRRFGLWRS